MNQEFEKNSFSGFFYSGLGDYLGERGRIIGTNAGAFFGALLWVVAAELIVGPGNAITLHGFAILGAGFGAFIGGGASAGLGAGLMMGIISLFQLFMNGFTSTPNIAWILIGSVMSDFGRRLFQMISLRAHHQ